MPRDNRKPDRLGAAVYFGIPSAPSGAFREFCGGKYNPTISHLQKLGNSMKPKPSCSTVPPGLFQSELKPISLRHSLVTLAGEFNWDAFEPQASTPGSWFLLIS